MANLSTTPKKRKPNKIFFIIKRMVTQIVVMGGVNVEEMVTQKRSQLAVGWDRQLG